MTDREHLRQSFIEESEWQAADVTPIPGDASARRYFRLAMEGQRAILMDYDPSDEPSESAKIYMQNAGLAGTDMRSFAAIGTALCRRGFSAPKIIAADTELGFLLLEDLSVDNAGRNVYARHLEAHPNDEPLLYEAAVDTLAAIYRSSFDQPLSCRHGDWTVPTFDLSAQLVELTLFTQWFVPDVGVELSEAALTEWENIWADMVPTLSAHAPGLALRDFHAENLFWCPEREATAQVGLIDFQDAVYTHPAYDLNSLLEDARRDVDRGLAKDLMARFCDKAGLADDDDFAAAYVVSGAQRKLKNLGFPVRSDKLYGKPQYRALHPRLKRHLQIYLAHPACAPLKVWLETYLPEGAL
ncbi:MAG: phosphotransferase [Maricaulaceae bacterium]